MLGEERRGTVLEQTISKLLFKGACQLVGMSATLSSMDRLQRFLSAHVFATDFRPVQLREHIKLGKQLYRFDPEIEEFVIDKQVKRMASVVRLFHDRAS